MFIRGVVMSTNVVLRSLYAAVGVWLLTGSSIADSDFALGKSTRLSHRPIAAQKEPQGNLLEPGKPIERELNGGESHSYLITFTAGQFLDATIVQRQVDLTAALFGPDGQQVGQFDSRWYGPEP